jgi:hypothetical protein
MSNASNRAIVFPHFGGIAFHHFHQESDEIKKIQSILSILSEGTYVPPSFRSHKFMTLCMEAGMASFDIAWSKP